MWLYVDVVCFSVRARNRKREQNILAAAIKVAKINWERKHALRKKYPNLFDPNYRWKIFPEH
jgi:hypothetical protein